MTVETKAQVERGPCACECGGTVKTPGAKYLPGHFQKTPEGRKVAAAAAAKSNAARAANRAERLPTEDRIQPDVPQPHVPGQLALPTPLPLQRVPIRPSHTAIDVAAALDAALSFVKTLDTWEQMTGAMKVIENVRREAWEQGYAEAVDDGAKS